MRFNGINHLAMVTGDMDATIGFWRDLLGMRLVAGLGQPGYRHYFFEISDSDLLAFFEWPGIEPVEEKDHGYPVSGRVAFDHVAFGLESEEDLWALQAKLAAAGFEVSGVIDHGFVLSIYTWDPNGIPIEFSVNVPGTDIRRRPHLVDEQPSKLAAEGPEPIPGRWPAALTAAPAAKRHIHPGAGRKLRP